MNRLEIMLFIIIISETLHVDSIEISFGFYCDSKIEPFNCSETNDILSVGI